MPFGQGGLHLEGGKPVPHSRHLQKAATSPAIFWQSDSGPLTQRMERSSMRGRAQLVAQTLQLLCVPAHQDRLGAEPFQSPRECRTNSAPRTPYCPEMQTRPARGPPYNRSSYGRLRAESALPKILGQRDAFSVDDQPRCGGLVEPFDHHDMVTRERFQVLAEVLRFIAQHAQRQPRRRMHPAAVLHGNRDHIPVGPGADADGQIVSVDSQKAIIDGKVLPETRFRERGALRAEGDIEEPALVVVAFEETVGCAIIAVNIQAIDLEAELLWRGPDESAHPPVADRDSLFLRRTGFS